MPALPSAAVLGGVSGRLGGKISGSGVQRRRTRIVGVDCGDALHAKQVLDEIRERFAAHSQLLERVGLGDEASAARWHILLQRC